VIDISRDYTRYYYDNGTHSSYPTSTTKPVITLGSSADASTPVINASELIIVESDVITSNEAALPDLSQGTTLTIRDFGKLARANGTAVRGVGDTEDTQLPVIELYGDKIDGSASVHLRGYPIIKDIETSYTASEITLTVTTDSVFNQDNIIVWLNYFDRPEGTQPQLRSTYTPGTWEQGTVRGSNDVYTVTVPTSWSAGDYSTSAGTYSGGALKTISFGTVRGVSTAEIPDIPSASITRVHSDGSKTKVAQAISEDWDNKNNKDLNYPNYFYDHHTNAVYSNETLEVTFTFAKAATKNETLDFSSTFYELKANGAPVDYDDMLKELLTYDTNILPAGQKSVPVTFAFKKLVNPILYKLGDDGSPLGTSGYITARVKDPNASDKLDHTFGAATTSETLRLFDVATHKASFVPPSVGSRGDVQLNFTGGSAGLYYRLPGKTEWHRYYDLGSEYYPKYEISSADIEAIFADGAVIEYKDANTGDKILQINGPNAGGGGGNVDPSVSHTVTLGAVDDASEYLVAGAGLYPTTNQTFAFDVFIPESEANEIQLSIVNSNNVPLNLDWDADLTNPPVDGRSSRKVIIRDITTDIRVTLSFVVPTGIEKLARPSVWSSSNAVTISSSLSGIARIYSLRGSLVSEFTYGVGSTSITLPVGLYIVTLSDGTTTKVIIK
jgi:hypothetical protein